MKLAFCLTFLTVICLVSSASVDLHPRGCIYIDGMCQEDCPEGTHSYTTGCGYVTPEATCDKPNPKTDTSIEVCDFTDCYCDPPTVRNPKTKKCVSLEECKKDD